MHFSPVRIVVAALAFIVGAVMPVMLSRKAEGSVALPLTADVVAAVVSAATLGEAGHAAPADAGDPTAELGDAIPGMRSPTHAGMDERVEPGLAAGRELVRGPVERLGHPIAGSAHSVPLPEPLTIIEKKRKYHLRP